MPTGDLYVLSSEKRKAKNNQEYCTLSVRRTKEDGGDTIAAKIWSNGLAASKAEPKAGMVIIAFFKETQWEGQSQLEIEKFSIRANPNLELFKTPPAVDQEATYKKLFFHSWKHTALNVFFQHLRDSLELLQGGRLKKILFEIPAGAKNHHSRRAGLLQHMEEMWDLAVLICGEKGPPHFEGGLVDLEVLLAGIVLHDLGKIHDYSPDTLAFESTRIGEYVGHTCWGALTLASLWPAGMEQEVMLKVTHCVLSHHGSHNAAAPVVPKIPEAQILHLIDAMSARLDVARTAEEASSQGKQVDFNRGLGMTPITNDYPKHLSE